MVVEVLMRWGGGAVPLLFFSCRYVAHTLSFSPEQLQYSTTGQAGGAACRSGSQVRRVVSVTDWKVQLLITNVRIGLLFDLALSCYTTLSLLPFRHCTTY